MLVKRLKLGKVHYNISSDIAVQCSLVCLCFVSSLVGVKFTHFTLTYTKLCVYVCGVCSLFGACSLYNVFSFCSVLDICVLCTVCRVCRLCRVSSSSPANSSWVFLQGQEFAQTLYVLLEIKKIQIRRPLIKLQNFVGAFARLGWTFYLCLCFCSNWF